jgi:uncharacterized protein (DUF2267 family)
LGQLHEIEPQIEAEGFQWFGIAPETVAGMKEMRAHLATVPQRHSMEDQMQWILNEGVSSGADGFRVACRELPSGDLTERMMSVTGLESFDRTIHKTNIWLKNLMEIMGCTDRQQAYASLRATLHALRDRLTIEETAQFAAQLPMLIRGFYYEGWDPTGKPVKERHRDEFLARIRRELERYQIDPEQVARAVFQVVVNRISEGEIEDVEHVLPHEIRDLWPSTVAQPQ